MKFTFSYQHTLGVTVLLGLLLPFEVNSADYTGTNYGGRNGQCEVRNGNQLYNYGRFVRYLTASDQQQLSEFQSKATAWGNNLSEHIQHEINRGMNGYREGMNRAFGTGGQFWNGFPFSQGAQTATNLPLYSSDQTNYVPVTSFPDPPAFCNAL